jgi:hypothetical protein
MTSIVIAAVAAAVLSGPVTPLTRAGRLEAFVLRINPAAEPYARVLARSILAESRRRHLDPHLLTAIVWSESCMQLRAPGAEGERGPWQILPTLSVLPRAWQELRADFGGVPEYPARWAQMTRADRAGVLRDPSLSTYLAAYLMAYIRRVWCRYPSTAVCYGRYNRPARPRWGYVRRLARRAYHVRRYVDADVP